MTVGLPFRLVFDPKGDELASAHSCEADVFLSHYGNTRQQLAAEYGRYADSSIFVALLDRQGDAVGACRLITPGPAGLKSVNDLDRPPWQIDGPRAARAVGMDPAHTWDVATIAVRKGAGAIRPLAAASLYHGLWAAARANHVRSIVMIMDERARRLLSAAAIMTRTIPGSGPGEYLGSPTSTPVYGHLAQMADAQRRLNPDAHRLIALGIGLDGIDIPSQEEYRLSVPSVRDAPIVDRRVPALSA